MTFKRYRDTVFNERGQKVARAVVTVYTDQAATQAATIYTTRDGGGGAVPGSQVVADGVGEYSFYAADGQYTLRVEAPGYDSVVIHDVTVGSGAWGRESVALVALSLAALQAAPQEADLATELRAGTRSGLFVYRVGDYSAQVAADPLMARYVPPASDPTGAAGCHVRDYTESVVHMGHYGVDLTGTFEASAAINQALDDYRAGQVQVVGYGQRPMRQLVGPGEGRVRVTTSLNFTRLFDGYVDLTGTRIEWARTTPDETWGWGTVVDAFGTNNLRVRGLNIYVPPGCRAKAGLAHGRIYIDSYTPGQVYDLRPAPFLTLEAPLIEGWFTSCCHYNFSSETMRVERARYVNHAVSPDTGPLLRPYVMVIDGHGHMVSGSYSRYTENRNPAGARPGTTNSNELVSCSLRAGGTSVGVVPLFINGVTTFRMSGYTVSSADHHVFIGRGGLDVRGREYQYTANLEFEVHREFVQSVHDAEIPTFIFKLDGSGPVEISKLKDKDHRLHPSAAVFTATDGTGDIVLRQCELDYAAPRSGRQQTRLFDPALQSRWWVDGVVRIEPADVVRARLLATSEAGSSLVRMLFNDPDLEVGGRLMFLDKRDGDAPEVGGVVLSGALVVVANDGEYVTVQAGSVATASETVDIAPGGKVRVAVVYPYMLDLASQVSRLDGVVDVGEFWPLLTLGRGAVQVAGVDGAHVLKGDIRMVGATSETVDMSEPTVALTISTPRRAGDEYVGLVGQRHTFDLADLVVAPGTVAQVLSPELARRVYDGDVYLVDRAGGLPPGVHVRAVRVAARQLRLDVSNLTGAVMVLPAGGWRVVSVCF